MTMKIIPQAPNAFSIELENDGEKITLGFRVSSDYPLRIQLYPRAPEKRYLVADRDGMDPVLRGLTLTLSEKAD